MTNLTRIAVQARKIIRYGVFFIIFLTVGKIVLDIGVGIYKKVFPAPPPAPTVKFGKLTKIPFPEKTSPKFSYVLETPQGGLPSDLPTQVKVFFMPKASANLLALDIAKQKAKSLGFANDPVQESDTLYKFTNPELPSNMDANIVTGTFSISYDLTADASPLETKPPIAEVAASEFRSALSSADILPDDLSGATTHNFYKLSGGTLVPVLSQSEADVIKVNLFRKKYEDLSPVTANPNESNVWAIISGSTNRNQQIIAAEYHYHAVDETQFSTYPLKTPQEAFDGLQNGQAFTASLGRYKEGDSIKIRRVYLAYFDPEEMSDFYQPVYVFDSAENDPKDSFIAYLPAITSDYYGQ